MVIDGRAEDTSSIFHPVRHLGNVGGRLGDAAGVRVSVYIVKDQLWVNFLPFIFLNLENVGSAKSRSNS